MRAAPGPAACVCIYRHSGAITVATHVTMATWRGLGQISLMMTGVCGPRGLTAWAGKVTMGYGFRPGASRSAPGDAAAGC